MSIIEVKKLQMAYEGKTVFSDLSFSVEKGDYFFIIGENGIGKSTLVKGILGLMQPVYGEIKFQGIVRKDFSYLSQTGEMPKDFPASVEEVVLSGRLLRKKFFSFYTKSDRSGARAALRMMGIYDLKNRSFNELSGGQAQRVLIARALAADSKVLILDEPTKGLDADTTNELNDLLIHLTHEHGITVICVSHDISAAKNGTKILKITSSGAVAGAPYEIL